MPNTTVEEVYLINRKNKQPQAPKTFARLVTDSARNQTLDASLNKLIECNALGFQEFSTLQPYAIDDVCFHDRRLWKFTEAKTAGVWDSTKVEEFTFKEYMDAIKAWANTTFAKTNGWYEQLVAGLAENLCGDTIVNAEFYKRKTGGTQSVGSGIAAIKEVRGKSLVWNQLVQNGNFVNGKWWNNVVVVNNEATLTLRSGSTNFQIFNHVTKIVGHKYFIHGSFKWSNISGIGMFRHIWYGGSNLIAVLTQGLPSENNKWEDFSFIVTGNTSYSNGEFNFICDLNSNAAEGDTYTARNIFCVDLTLMFGAGNEPATVEEFEKMFPLDYYDYNEGEVIPFAGQNLVTTGFNQWDEQWESGYYDGKGNYNNVNNQLCTKNFINVFPNTDYYIKHPYTVEVVLYDSDKNFLSRMEGVYGNAIFNTGNAYYIKFNLKTSYGTTYNHDICINISNPDRDGTYEPYEKHTLPLDPSQWRDKNGNLVFPYGGMHGVGTAYDYAKVDADGYIRSVVRCFEQVDLGDETWTRNQGGNDSHWYVFETETYSLPNCPMTGVNDLANIICGLFTVDTHTQIKWKEPSLNNVIAEKNASLTIRCDTYTDVSTFTAAMQGVPLIYELATPVEVELATPVYAKYLVDKDGTEEITPANGSTPYTTMANLSILYAMDARGEIKNLPKNYLSKESAENMLNAMVSAGVIASYTMTWDSTNNRYVFTFTKAEQASTNSVNNESNI